MNIIILYDFIKSVFITTDLEKINTELFVFSNKYYAVIKTQDEFIELITSNVAHSNIIMFSFHEYNKKKYISIHIGDYRDELFRLSTTNVF